MKISIILGTRPEIIKMAPIIRECQSLGLDYFTLHTGQHYSYNLDEVFFKELELPAVKYNLNIGSGSHAEETAKMLPCIEKILIKESPDIVLVQGDTNTVLAGALAASKLHIKVGHVEAGLRSYDRNMPEEINRIITDHISDYSFVPTESARYNLIKEGIGADNIHLVGNTIVDSVYQNLEIAKNKSNILSELNLLDTKYFLITSHRQENVDKKEKLEGILYALSQIYSEYKLPIIYPVHPRTKKMLDKFELEPPEHVALIEPLGFLDFLQLEANADIILTDSGGIQEESCILKVPCVTLRENTERPETLAVGGNILAGTSPESILSGVAKMMHRPRNWQNPFGDGKTGERIIKILCD